MPTPWTCGSRLWLATSDCSAEHQLQSRVAFSEFLETWVRRHRMVLDRSMLKRCVFAYQTHDPLLL